MTNCSIDVPPDETLEALDSEQLAKITSVLTGLREALNEYDATRHGVCDAPCVLCTAIASVRHHLDKAEIALELVKP